MTNSNYDTFVIIKENYEIINTLTKIKEIKQSCAKKHTRNDDFEQYETSESKVEMFFILCTVIWDLF